MVGVGRDLWGSSSPPPLPKQGHLQQATCVFKTCVVVSCVVWSFIFFNNHKKAAAPRSACVRGGVCAARPRAAVVVFLQVVPLSQRSGVLEWCSGTTPIGEFLVNADEGAHKRYRPKDYSGYQCQKIMMVSQNNENKK